MSAQDIFTAVVMKNVDEAQEHFKSSVAERISDLLDQKRLEVAQNMFNHKSAKE